MVLIITPTSNSDSIASENERLSKPNHPYLPLKGDIVDPLHEMKISIQSISCPLRGQHYQSLDSVQECSSMEVELETNLRQIGNESLFHNIVYAKMEVQCLKNVCVTSISSAPAIYYDAKSGVDKERTTPSAFTVLEND